MEEKIPRTWLYIIVVLLLAIVAVLAGKSLFYRNDTSGSSQALDEKNRELDEKNRQFQDMNNRIAELQKDLEESSKKMEELQAKVDDATKTLSSTQDKLRSAQRDAGRLTSNQPPAGARVASRPVDSGAPVSSRRPADPGIYEVVRATSVYEDPADSARKVSSINKGTRITVVRSTGDWLEVRSKHGNPPGFIRRDDAMFIERSN